MPAWLAPAPSRRNFIPLERAAETFAFSPAFTLIELLVVMGLIVVLVTGAGFAFGGRGGEGAALVNAQATLASLVGSARTQAVLHQTTTRLLVDASPPPTADAAKYLRYLQVVREEPFGSGDWVAAGAVEILPASICVVPPSVPRSHLVNGVNWTGTLAVGPISALAGPVTMRVIGQSKVIDGRQLGTAHRFGGESSGRAYYLEFAPDGTVTGRGTSLKIALSTVTLAAGGLPRFNNPNSVRGVILHKSGAVAWVNDARGF